MLLKRNVDMSLVVMSPASSAAPMGVPLVTGKAGKKRLTKVLTSTAKRTGLRSEEERGHVSGSDVAREFGGADGSAVGDGESGEEEVNEGIDVDSKKDGVAIGRGTWTCLW